MNEWFDMGKYGLYVWTSYGLFAAVLMWDALMPHLRARRFLRSLTRKQQRETARKTA